MIIAHGSVDLRLHGLHPLPLHGQVMLHACLDVQHLIRSIGRAHVAYEENWCFCKVRRCDVIETLLPHSHVGQNLLMLRFKPAREYAQTSAVNGAGSIRMKEWFGKRRHRNGRWVPALRALRHADIRLHQAHPARRQRTPRSGPGRHAAS